MLLDAYHIRGQTVVVNHGIHEVDVVLPGPIPVNGHPTDNRRIHSQRHIVRLIDKREVDKRDAFECRDRLARSRGLSHSCLDFYCRLGPGLCAAVIRRRALPGQIVPRAKP